ncbi:MAG: hypothetical protein U1D97_07465 [Desulfuromonadales bacterium]|nr:hypothetical protein [Desulfuromonadales bacterium]
MPRAARIALPNYPHHVIQRGHNRQAVFAEADDYRYYLDNLAAWKTAYDCKVFAYCLTNHVHLIIDPGEDPEHLGQLMKRVSRRKITRGRVVPRTSVAFGGAATALSGVPDLLTSLPNVSAAESKCVGKGGRARAVNKSVLFFVTACPLIKLNFAE